MESYKKHGSRASIASLLVYLRTFHEQMLGTVPLRTDSCTPHLMVPDELGGAKQVHKEDESGSDEDDDSDLMRNTNRDFDVADDESDEGGDTSEEEDGDED